jgi:hypothetical protein
MKLKDATKESIAELKLKGCKIGILSGFNAC